MNCVYSVYNVTRKQWSTNTNYSTKAEAERLMACIVRQCKQDTYEVQERKFGTLKEQRI